MATQTYTRYTLRHSKYGGVDVLGWSTYPSHSVLAGQSQKVFLDNFPSVEDAQRAYPAATDFSSDLTDSPVSLTHLPGEDDPVPGGMYLDDYDDGL